MLSLICLILVGGAVSVGSFGVMSFGAYTVIDRLALSHSCITSLSPKASLAHSPPRTEAGCIGACPISEIIWLSCPFSLNALDDVAAVVDDDNFASRLCDRGYKVHVIEPNGGSCYLSSLAEAIRWRVEEAQIPAASLCVVANELTCTHVLNYLSEATSSTNSFQSTGWPTVGAVVLIDPPPLHALSSPQGRRSVWRRYLTPILQALAGRKNTNTNQAKRSKKLKSRRRSEREKQTPSRYSK